MKRILALISVLTVIGLFVIPSGVAFADQTYHSEYLPVHSDTGYPLRNGMVVNIHTNGQTDFAVEEYVLNGAKPNTTYKLCRAFEESLLGLTDPWDALDTFFVLHTDKNGNGHCTVKVLTAQIAPLVAVGQTTLHVKFVFIVGGTSVPIIPGVLEKIVGGTIAYTTDVTEIHFDDIHVPPYP